MSKIYANPDLTPDASRNEIYAGHLVVLTRLRALGEFVDYTREELRRQFTPHDPQHDHENIKPAKMARILGAWKPRFIHADRSRELVRAIITEVGFPAEHNHFGLAPGDNPAHSFIPLPEPGAVLLFSGAHLHASIPNTSDRAGSVSTSARWMCVT